MYQRKTFDEFQIQGDYGYGYEEVASETTLAEARQRLKEYRENERGISFKIVKKRVKNGNSKATQAAAMALLSATIIEAVLYTF